MSIVGPCHARGHGESAGTLGFWRVARQRRANGSGGQRVRVSTAQLPGLNAATGHEHEHEYQPPPAVE